MKFTDDTKQVKEFDSKYFAFGVHKVQLVLFELGGTEEGEKEYIEVTVCDPEDGEKTDTARVWFSTENAANYAFNTLRAIAVHNAKDANKDVMKKAIDAVADTEDLVNFLNDKLVGKEAWFTKFYDPNRTYTNQNGETKRSVNKNIYGYEPADHPELMPSDETSRPASAASANTSIPETDDWAE